MTEQTRSTINGRYDGNGSALFRLALITSLLTVITLGIYRFWGKTRIRKYIWSSTSADGDRFEYTGTGLEKFLGFLVAIAILAVYLGIIQMALFYFGLNMFVEPQTEQQMLTQLAALYISFFAVVPLIFFAQYRARRYKLARTRWRGVRFGAEKAAWGYAIRAIVHSIITGVTLGILLPRQTFYLEKYLTDRTWYGDKRFTQYGSWPKLYKAMTQLFIGVLIIVCGIVLAVVTESVAMTVIFVLVGYIWFYVGLVSYQVQSFIYLTGEKLLGDDIHFTGRPETRRIVVTFLLGGLLVGVIVGVGSAILNLVLTATLISAAATSTGAIVIIAVGYLAFVAIIGAITLVAIIQPIICHVIESVTVYNASALSDVIQRDADTGADAEGFADALDVGGAF